jgi:hypothetical protein
MNFAYDVHTEETEPLDLEKLKTFVEDGLFKTAPNESINLYLFYCVHRECEEYEVLTFPLGPDGTLDKASFLRLLSEFRTRNGRKYNVVGLHTYHVGMKDVGLVDFYNAETDPYLTTHKKFDQTVQFPPSLEFFQHHNSMFIFLMSEQVKKTKRTSMPTKRITMKSNAS